MTASKSKRVRVSARRLTRELGDDIAEQAAAWPTARPPCAGPARCSQPSSSAIFGDRQPARAAAGDEDRVRGSMPWLIVMSRDRGDHVLVGDRERSPRPPRWTRGRAARRSRLDRLARRLRVELQPAAEEIAGIDVAEHDGRVGHRRLGAAAPVTGRARAPRRRSAGPTRSSPPGSIQAMLPPPAPTFFTSTEERPVMWPVNTLAEPGLTRELDLAVAHHADVEARPAGVADDEVCRSAPRTDLAGRPAPSPARSSPSRAAARPRPRACSTPPNEVDDEQLTARSPAARRSRSMSARCALHQRLERGVDRGRRGAPVLADDRVQPVREGERHAGQLAPRSAPPTALLVRRVDDRPEQRDGDRLHPLLLAPRRATRPLASAVERDDDLALGGDPLAAPRRSAAAGCTARDKAWRKSNGRSLPPSRNTSVSRKARGGDQRGRWPYRR